MVDIVSLRRELDKKVGQRNLLIAQKEESVNKKKQLEETHENIIKARSIVQTVAENTQKQLEFHISNLVSSAIAAVFPDPYTFSLRFVQRRNKTEADLIFTKDGNDTSDLVNTAGGGVVDVASFALRTALWSIHRNRHILILDEPFRFLSTDMQEKASDMVKKISEKLNLQIIMVSHLPGMIKAADKVIEVKNERGVSIAGN